jgi:hypothetical protein
MSKSTIVNAASKATVHFRTMGAEKQHCTIMLAITADGQKLPVYELFKCSTVAHGKLPSSKYSMDPGNWLDA